MVAAMCAAPAHSAGCCAQAFSAPFQLAADMSAVAGCRRLMSWCGACVPALSSRFAAQTETRDPELRADEHEARQQMHGDLQHHTSECSLLLCGQARRRAEAPTRPGAAARTAVRQVVPVDAGEHDVVDAPRRDRLRRVLRLGRVQRRRRPRRLHRAEPATPADAQQVMDQAECLGALSFCWTSTETLQQSERLAEAAPSM